MWLAALQDDDDADLPVLDAAVPPRAHVVLPELPADFFGPCGKKMLFPNPHRKSVSSAFASSL